jgi:hypothetical protein
MTTWKQAAHRALYSGAAAAALSAITLAVCGKLEGNTASGPLNGPSQWLWKRQAAHRRQASLRYTLVGYAIHHLASVAWATVHEKHVASRVQGRGIAAHFAAGAATAALACAVDYGVARGRLQPGFDKQLSRKSLIAVYLSFGLGLALGCAGRVRRPHASASRDSGSSGLAAGPAIGTPRVSKREP